MFLNNPSNFNMSIGSSPINIISSSCLQLLQIIERVNPCSKMYYVSGFLSFLHLPEIMQQIFFYINLFIYWKYFSIILSFFSYSLGENEFV